MLNQCAEKVGRVVVIYERYLPLVPLLLLSLFSHYLLTWNLWLKKRRRRGNWEVGRRRQDIAPPPPTKSSLLPSFIRGEFLLSLLTNEHAHFSFINLCHLNKLQKNPCGSCNIAKGRRIPYLMVSHTLFPPLPPPPSHFSLEQHENSPFCSHLPRPPSHGAR